MIKRVWNSARSGAVFGLVMIAEGVWLWQAKAYDFPGLPQSIALRNAVMLGAMKLLILTAVSKFIADSDAWGEIMALVLTIIFAFALPFFFAAISWLEIQVPFPIWSICISLISGVAVMVITHKLRKVFYYKISTRL